MKNMFGLFLACIIELSWALYFAKVAVDKGHSKWYYLYSIIGGPYVFILIAALPDYRTSVGIYNDLKSRDGFYNPKEKEPEKRAEPVFIAPPVSGGWTCTCGRNHPAYVSSCPCGVSKSQIKK